MGRNGVEVNGDVLKHRRSGRGEKKKTQARLATVCILHYQRSTAI
jgi:hypothetical protein